jgi:hypothetical protein
VGEDTRQIEDTIREERTDLGRNLQELQSQARALADWRTHYRRHTGIAIGAAFAGGVVLGFASRRHHTPARDVYAPESEFHAVESTPSHRSPLAALRQVADSPRARRQISETWEGILSSLVGVGTAQVVNWLGSLVPGFRDEFDTRRGHRPGDGHAHTASAR